MSSLAVNEITDEVGTGGPSFSNGLNINSQIFTFNTIPRFSLAINIDHNAFAEIVTPGINSGFVFLQRRLKNNVFPNGQESGIAFLDWGDSSGTGAFIVAGGTRFTISTNGEPTGTSGVLEYITFFQGGPSETFYLENRTGNPENWLITIL